MNRTLASKLKQRSSRRGSTAVEFITIFPAFLILCFFVLELGFWYADRHLLKLATFDAARSLLTEQYAASGSTGSCEDSMDFPSLNAEQQIDAKSKAMNAAHRELAVKMAYTAPPATSFLGAVGIHVNPGDYLGAFTPGGASGSPILKSLGQLLLRFPSSYALTQLESCQYDAANNSITVKSRYLRQAKMPIVDRIIWLVFAITKINEAITSSGFSGALHLELDNFYLRAKPTSPGLIQLQNQVVAFRQKLKDTIATLHGVPLNLEAASVALGQFPFLDHLAQESVNYTHAWQSQANTLDQSLISFQNQIQQASAVLEQQGHVVNALIFAMPSELRLVPMYQSVTLSLAKERNRNNWDGVAAGIAPFTQVVSVEVEPGETQPPSDDIWAQWTRGMSKNQGEMGQ